MSVLVCVDTNVLIYARDPRDPDKRARAQAWLRTLAQKVCLVINLQTINEFHSVASRRLGLNPASAAAASRELFVWCDRGMEKADVERAFDIQQRYMTSWWDALQMSAAISRGCTHFLTEDAQSAPQIGGLKIISPFALLPAAVV